MPPISPLSVPVAGLVYHAYFPLRPATIAQLLNKYVQPQQSVFGWVAERHPSLFWNVVDHQSSLIADRQR
jgi:hypothetical protein